MKKNMIAVTAVLIGAAVLGGIFAISAFAFPSDNEYKLTASKTVAQSITDNKAMQSIVSDTAAQSTERIELSAEQLQKLEELRDKARPFIGIFEYQEKLVTGEVDVSAPRLDLETALRIISENSDFSLILNEIEKVQKYPDFIGGSGVTLIEYWLNNAGNSKILIVCESGLICLVDYDADGNIISNVTLFEQGR